ncbi:hypothetical protein V2I49_02375 [Pseudomonas viridiflava]|uniref:hypothetical protein n=1 Tax=Pseudomonas viridiflava TaxID=33069 RepID=UPI002E9961A5|nr:hypothetical protein [Pseudomonas viridiflava]
MSKNTKSPCGGNDLDVITEKFAGVAMTKCALFRLEKNLKNSHLIPTSAYAHLRCDTNFGVQQSVKLNLLNKTAVQTDVQVKQYLLCGDCEDLFSKHGERIIGTLWATQSGFPLFEMLSNKAPRIKAGPMWVYNSSAVDSATLKALRYFAFSVFWRTHVWDWMHEKDPYGKALGDKYAEKIRLFLLSGTEFEDYALMIEVNSDENSRAMFSFPAVNRVDGAWYHSFVILGIRFILVVGRARGEKAKSMFDAVGENNCFLINDFGKTKVYTDVNISAGSGVDVRGKLRKLDLGAITRK